MSNTTNPPPPPPTLDQSSSQRRIVILPVLSYPSNSIEPTIHPLLISPTDQLALNHPITTTPNPPSTSEPTPNNTPQTHPSSLSRFLKSSIIPPSTSEQLPPSQSPSVKNYILPTSYQPRSSFHPKRPTTPSPNPSHPPPPSIDPTPCLVSHHPQSIQSTNNNPLHHPQSTIATDALLFQNLRADAQALGLESHSLGWAIVQFIHNREPAGRGLGSISNVIERLMAIDDSLGFLLLLPKSKSIDESLSLDTILQHIILTTPSNQTLDHPDSAAEHYLCNLYGWKGLLEGDRILFSSPGRPIDLHSIDRLDSRFILSNVKPSTCLSNELTSPAQLRFPIYNLLSPPSKTITIPRCLSSSSSSRGGSTAQRLASLFVPKSESEPLTIPVRVIDRSLDPSELDQSITQAVANRITDGLGSLEESMLNVIRGFLARFSIPDRSFSFTSDSHLSRREGRSLHLASYHEIGDAIQEMYQEIDQQLEKEYHEELNSTESTDETRLIIDHTLELIEEVVCVELYDRLFEDCAEDQELSQKIAQLNLLDLNLDHLGLDLDRREMDEPDSIMMIRSGLDDITKAASAELSKLQEAECRSPRDKVGVYVAVHKLIVDGLSSLPSIPMKRDGIPAAVLTQKSSQDEKSSHEVEMSDTLDRAAIAHDTVTMDRTLPMSSPLRPVVKDRPSARDLLDAIHTNLIDPPELPSENSEPVRPPSPDLRKVNVARPNSSSADLILPILIYLIIKSNPNGLKSNLNYVSRFRYQRLVTGETDYCLVNFDVSCEFIKNFTALDSCETTQTSSLGQTTRRDPSGEMSDSLDSRQIGTTGYGTFPSSFKDNREKSSNNTEVEEAFMAASRAVGGVLMGGYQKVISSSLLDTSVAKLGLTGGTRSAPRTLEDVKKLIGSGSGGRSESSMSSWSNRVGLLRRNLNGERSDPSLQRNPRGIEPASHASNAVTRLSSLFQNNSPGPSNAAVHTSNSVAMSQTDEDRVTIGQRLSSLPGLGRLGNQSTRSKEIFNFERAHNDEAHGYAAKDIRHGGSERSTTDQGPIERFESYESSDQLLMSDIPILLADYQRLSRVGRAAGLW